MLLTLYKAREDGRAAGFWPKTSLRSPANDEAQLRIGGNVQQRGKRFVHSSPPAACRPNAHVCRLASRNAKAFPLAHARGWPRGARGCGRSLSAACLGLGAAPRPRRRRARPCLSPALTETEVISDIRSLPAFQLSLFLYSYLRSSACVLLLCYARGMLVEMTEWAALVASSALAVLSTVAKSDRLSGVSNFNLCHPHRCSP